MAVAEKPPRIAHFELQTPAVGLMHLNLNAHYVGRLTCGHMTVWPATPHSAKLLVFGRVTSCHLCEQGREP